ncbi:phosphoadenosine phosphosulfate reductase family protein [Endozoicomonas sp. ALB091]|uniref:phosphoadenosine phosphosulfate reductase domain-containing protein n=1 Tax=Endozoicomonas sp. ALB091 TaxID=3403073 RepID=UPI003BB6D748
MEDTQHILSLSGGKDSTALALLGREELEANEIANLMLVFADTGNEHQDTYDYVDYLQNKVFKSVPFKTVKADFSVQMGKKRAFIQEHWKEDLVAAGLSEAEAEDRVAKALNILRPTGNPFLDLCLWKGRFPSTRRRFCSEELKHKPIDKQVIEPALEEYDDVFSWQGVRADESPSRAKLAEFEEHPTRWGLTTFRPILSWNVDRVFDMHRKHGVKPNPLYKQGMKRVGCMPCIHCGKKEMREIARRFPEEVKRISEWEAMVSDAAKRGVSTFMDARVTAKLLNTGTSVDEIHHTTHGIHAYVDWAKTSHGGKQIDLIAVAEQDDIPLCSSLYGLCE